MGFGEVAMAALYFVLRFGLAFSDRLGGVNLPNTFFFISLHPVSGQQHSWHKLCFEPKIRNYHPIHD